MHVARSLAMLVVALGATLGLAVPASAALCTGSGVAITQTGSVVRFSTATGAVTQTLLGQSSDMPGVAISPDGTTAYTYDHAFTGNADAYVYDLATMTRSATLTSGAVQPAAATAIALSRDGTRLYVAYYDNNTGTVTTRIRVIATATRAVVGTYATPGGGFDVTSLVVSPDGSTVYAAADRLYSFNAVDGTDVRALSGPGEALRVVLSPDGATRYLLSDMSQTVSVQRGTGQATPLAGPLGGRGLSLALSPDGGTLYAGAEGTGSNALFAVSTTSGATTPIGAAGTTFGTLAVTVAPDGGTIFAGLNNQLALLSPTGSALASVSSSAIIALALCPAAAPSSPTTVIGDPGDTLVNVSWTAPASTGGAAITRYAVTASPGGATCATTGATSCTVSGLKNTTGYTFTVTATNVAGTSPASTASAKVTPRKDNRARVLVLGPTSVTFTKKGIGIAFNVTATGPGVIAAAMTFKGDRYCSVAKRVPTAGTYRVKCVMAAAGRSLARKRRVTYTLLASFSPTNGPLASAKVAVTVPRRR